MFYVCSETKYENGPTDEPFDPKKITWFRVRANLNETKRELEEKRAAIKRQMEMGIIQANGLPAGLDPTMLGLRAQPQRPPQRRIDISQLRPQQRIQLIKQQQMELQRRQALEKPKTQEELLYSKFGIRK